MNSVLPKGVKKVKTKKDVPTALVETLLSTNANLTILSFADLAVLDDKYRINTPSTVGNWTVRYEKSLFTQELSEKLLALTKKYKRI